VNYVRTICLSIAHTDFSPGASYGSLNEYKVSTTLTEKVAEILDEELLKDREDQAVVFFDVSDEELDENYSEALRQKSRICNEEAPNSDDLVLEIHCNTPKSKGSCVLHRKESVEGAKAAAKILESLEELELFGKHYTGVIPIPGPYRDIRLSFLEKTKAVAVIVEVASIKQVVESWSPSTVESIARAIARGIVGYLDS